MLKEALYGKPGQLPAVNYQTHARDGYQSNPTVYSCVSARSENLSTIDLILKQRRGKAEREKYQDHPLLELLNNPNPEQSKSDFLEYIEGSLCLDGNCYIKIITQLSSKIPIGLIPLQTNSVEPELKTVGGLQQKVYKYTSDEGRQETYSAGEVIHIKLYNPLSMLKGLGPITAARYAYNQNNQSGVWNHSLLLNSAKPSGILTTDSVIQEKQEDQIRRMIDKMVGSERAGRPALFHAGLKWQNIGLSPADMDWINGMKFTALQVCMAFKVPAQCVGIPDSQTYANMEQAERSLWQNAVKPDAGRIINAFNQRLTPLFDKNLYLDADWDKVPQLRDSQNDLYNRVKLADWWTINEKRRATQQEDIEDGDVILVPAGMIPLELALEEPAPLVEDVPDDGAVSPFGAGGY
jgi:HK97 family phage portal protein